MDIIEDKIGPEKKDSKKSHPPHHPPHHGKNELPPHILHEMLLMREKIGKLEGQVEILIRQLNK